jgi:phosphomannomutase/phosphoglucomutase
MDQSIFRAYSIRGIFDKTLTPTDMYLIGQAAGTMLGDAGITHAVVGRDYRLSSAELSTVLVKGLVSTGMHLADIGTCPTPLLNFATDYYRAGAGLMVTASHNPPQYNGLKIRTDHTLCDDELQTLYQITRAHAHEDKAFRRGDGTVSCQRPLGDYLGAICRRTQVHRRLGNRTLRLVVDAGNGAAGPVVPLLLERLGCQAIPLHCVPDGRFPGRVPDPTAAGALDELSARVVAEGADAGLAYDGDGDRLAMVDDRGQPVYADRLLILLAQEALPAHPGARVVYELTCTQALPERIETLGGEAIACRVGYAFVHEAMRAAGAILGGETAGHLFFDDPDFLFDDAMLATAKMVALLSRAEGPLSALLARLPQYVRSPQYRLHCPDDLKSIVVNLVCEQLARQGRDINHLDGAKVRFEDGWALFRASNTQPAVTLHCEAINSERLDIIRDTVLRIVQDTLIGLGIDVTDTH